VKPRWIGQLFTCLCALWCGLWQRRCWRSRWDLLLKCTSAASAHGLCRRTCLEQCSASQGFRLRFALPCWPVTRRLLSVVQDPSSIPDHWNHWDVRYERLMRIGNRVWTNFFRLLNPSLESVGRSGFHGVHNLLAPMAPLSQRAFLSLNEISLWP
jgi:hypothetical protein